MYVESVEISFLDLKFLSERSILHPILVFKKKKKHNNPLNSVNLLTRTNWLISIPHKTSITKGVTALSPWGSFGRKILSSEIKWNHSSFTWRFFLDTLPSTPGLHPEGHHLGNFNHWNGKIRENDLHFSLCTSLIFDRSLISWASRTLRRCQSLILGNFVTSHSKFFTKVRFSSYVLHTLKVSVMNWITNRKMAWIVWSRINEWSNFSGNRWRLYSFRFRRWWFSQVRVEEILHGTRRQGSSWFSP